MHFPGAVGSELRRDSGREEMGLERMGLACFFSRFFLARPSTFFCVTMRSGRDGDGVEETVLGDGGGESSISGSAQQL